MPSMRKPNRYLFLGAIVLTLALAFTSWGFPLRSKLGLAEVDYRMIFISSDHDRFTSAWWKKNEHRLTDWTKLPIDWKSDANKTTWEEAKQLLRKRHNTEALLKIYCPDQPYEPTSSISIWRTYKYEATDHWLAAAAGVLFDCPTGSEPMTMPANLAMGSAGAFWGILDQLPASLSPYQARILILTQWATRNLKADHRPIVDQLLSHGHGDIYLEMASFDIGVDEFRKDRKNELKRLALVEDAQLLSFKYPGYNSDLRVSAAGSYRIKVHRDEAALNRYITQLVALQKVVMGGDKMDREVGNNTHHRLIEKWNTVSRKSIFGSKSEPLKL